MDYLLNYAQEIKNYWTAFVRIIYPTFCLICESSLEINECYLCDSCQAQIPHLKQPLCRKCAAEVPPFAELSSRCPSCRSMKTYYHQGTALFPYRDAVKKILHVVKFEKKPWYVKSFKKSIAKANFALPIHKYDFMVPVPADPKRKKQREFNTAHLIAESIAQLPNAPGIKPILKKIKSTAPQSELDRSKRLSNLFGTFRLIRSENVRHKRVLLVDDIVTTGATINECAKCLKEADVSCVDFFALARTTSS